MTTCIYCTNELDNSPEHIIPVALNGRLQSRQIICSTCNNLFGRKVDPVLKEALNIALLMLQLDNAKGFHADSPDGQSFLIDRESKVIPLRPVISKVEIDGQPAIQVKGTKEHVAGLTRKFEKLLKPYGLKPALINEEQHFNPPLPVLSAPYEIKISPDLSLALNKIATEFYALQGFDIQHIKHLLEPIHLLDQALNNVHYINETGDLRKYETGEISHLILLKSSESGMLYAYIELFNIICAVVILNVRYKGPSVHVNYWQDAETGAVFTPSIPLQLDLSSGILGAKVRSFETLINNFSSRLNDRRLTKALEKTVKAIQKKVTDDLATGVITKEQVKEEMLKRSGIALAELLILHFPYTVTEIHGDRLPLVNMIHSNYTDEQFEELKRINSHAFGIKLRFSPIEEFFIDSLFQGVRTVYEGQTLRKVHVKLKNIHTSDYIYVDYATVVKMINQATVKED